MVTSVASVTGGIASLLLSALVLCFDVPRFVASGTWARIAPPAHAHTAGGGKTGFHATASVEDVGRGDKRITVRLDFGPGERDEDEGL